jgi:hypothetical protein
VQTSHLRTLNNSLWNLDDEQLRIQLNNIVSKRDIILIEIAYTNKVLFSAGEPIVDQQIIYEKYEMTHDNGHIVENIGTRFVYTSLTHIYERLFRRMFIILITQELKTLLVALFFYLSYIARSFVISSRFHIMPSSSDSKNLTIVLRLRNSKSQTGAGRRTDRAH